jgi:hypothetical protein
VRRKAAAFVFPRIEYPKHSPVTARRKECTKKLPRSILGIKSLKHSSLPVPLTARRGECGEKLPRIPTIEYPKAQGSRFCWDSYATRNCRILVFGLDAHLEFPTGKVLSQRNESVLQSILRVGLDWTGFSWTGVPHCNACLLPVVCLAWLRLLLFFVLLGCGASVVCFVWLPVVCFAGVPADCFAGVHVVCFV